MSLQHLKDTLETLSNKHPHSIIKLLPLTDEIEKALLYAEEAIEGQAESIRNLASVNLQLKYDKHQLENELELFKEKRLPPTEKLVEHKIQEFPDISLKHGKYYYEGKYIGEVSPSDMYMLGMFFGRLHND